MYFNCKQNAKCKVNGKVDFFCQSFEMNIKSL